MATAGASTAFMVVEEDATLPAADTTIGAVMLAIVDVDHHLPEAVAVTTAVALHAAPMLHLRVVVRLMVPLMPLQHVAARPMAPPVRLTAAEANRTAVANITRR
jgi:hypothetical protein